MNKFEEVIQDYLNNQAEKDAHLAERMKIQSKNITDCCKYIIGEVKKTDRQGFADEEIYAMARHYYLEDDLTIDTNAIARVVINREIQATTKTKKEKLAKQVEVKTHEQILLFD